MRNALPVAQLHCVQIYWRPRVVADLAHQSNKHRRENVFHHDDTLHIITNAAVDPTFKYGL